jgi:hypothetical protein
VDSKPCSQADRSFIRRLACAAASLEPVIILALAPFFVFPRRELTPWLMIVVPLLWGIRWLARGRLTVRTPVDIPLLIMTLMLPVSLGATFDLGRSFPKICGVFLGIAFFYALANALRTERAIWVTVGLLVAGGVAVALISLVGTSWSTEKVPLLASSLGALYERFPTLLHGIPRAEEGFNPNQVGGTLTLFVPLITALLVGRLRRARLRVGYILSLLALVAALAVTVTVLLLTQSRLSYVSAALGLLLLGVLHKGWPRALSLVLLALGIGLVAYLGFPRVARGMFDVQVVNTLDSEVTWSGRAETWRRALRVIRDHPLTGIGFDTLFPVIHARYPTFLLPAGQDVTHAHNLFLQVALDLGLPGLLAFLWLLGGVGWMLWRVRQRAASPARQALAMGLLCGTAAQLLFGVADAIALGQKPGLFLWTVFGLSAALWNASRATAAEGAQAPADAGHEDFGEAASPSTGEPEGDAPDHVDASSSIVPRLAELPQPSSVVHRVLTIHFRPVLLTLVLLLVVGWAWRGVTRARGWASLLQDDLQAVAALGQGDGLAGGLWRADDLLHRTRSDLQGLQSEFRLPLVLASHLGWVPRWGADIAAVPRLVRIGLLLTEVGERVLEPLQPLVGSGQEGAAVDKDLALVAQSLESAAPRLEEGISRLEEVHQIRAEIRADDLSPLLADWVARLDQALPVAEDGLRAALALPDLLGTSGPRTYLILAQNDDELRPTGGFISGAARLSLAGGSVSGLDFEDSYAVDDFSNPYPEPPRPLYEIMGAELWVFRDSNWSPDFPTAAQKAAELYQLRYDVALDGVIALDQRAVQLFVTALGPLDVEGHPEPVTGENVIEAVRQSWEPPEEGTTDEWWLGRKDFMGDLLTEAVITMQEEPERVSLSAVAGAAVQALQERHLLIYVPEENPASDPIHEAGWDGAVREVDGDYLMVVDANLGFNKVDPYVRETIRYAVDLQDPRRPRAELTLEHHHQGDATDQPCRHTPRYDLTYEGMMERCYWDYARAYVPQGAELLQATSHPVPGEMLVTGRDRSGEAEVLPDEAGKSVFATFFVLPPGERTRSEFRYTLPATVLERAGRAWRYRLTIQKQPGTGARDVTVVLKLPEGAELVGASPPLARGEEGHVVAELSLQTDAVLDVRFRVP